MKKQPLHVIVLAFCSVLLVAIGCATNPVTGKNELLFVGENWELDVGAKNYLPLRQSQGGDYVVDPAVVKYVREVGNRLAAKSDRKLPYEFNVLNDSVPNAWALPGGKISINRGLLLELKNEAELAAVLGHEIVHAAAKHGARGQSRGILLQGAVMAATIAGNQKGYGQAAQMGASLAAQLTNSKYGRDAELESDFYGMNYMSRAGYDVGGAVELQKTFVRLSEGRNSDFISGLFASHPPSQERVQKNIQTAASLPKGGDLGEARYRKIMRKLEATKGAYKLFDDATIAKKEGKTAEAVALVNKAIRIEPKEAHFHSFLGDVDLEKKQYKTALSRFNKAISLNKDFYYYYVRRGQVNEATGKMVAARKDYNRSLSLMPTAEAQYGLGAIALRGKDEASAKRYFAEAAQSSSNIGQQAKSALMKLGVSGDKQNYLIVNRGLSEKGTFALQLINQTSRPLTGIKLSIRGVGENNATVQSIQGVLAPGATQIVDTGKPMTLRQSRAIQVSVADVRVQ